MYLTHKVICCIVLLTLKAQSVYIWSFSVIERFCLPPDAKVTYKDATEKSMQKYSVTSKELGYNPDIINFVN